MHPKRRLLVPYEPAAAQGSTAKPSGPDIVGVGQPDCSAQSLFPHRARSAHRQPKRRSTTAANSSRVSTVSPF